MSFKKKLMQEDTYGMYYIDIFLHVMLCPPFLGKKMLLK